jgi:hypothetical protein
MKMNALVLAIAALTSLGCSKDLSRSRAKSLISAKLQKSPAPNTVITGFFLLGRQSEADFFASPDGRYYRSLESDGLLRIVSNGKRYNPYQAGPDRDWFNSLDIQLTDNGKKYLFGPSKTFQETVYQSVNFCTREIVEVTGIRSDANSAAVDYTWRYGKLTPFAVHMRETRPDRHTCETSTTQTSTAAFRRYDDGWRLESDT